MLQLLSYVCVCVAVERSLLALVAALVLLLSAQPAASITFAA